MKSHTEQILVVGGSIFLVGLIIADILIQRDPEVKKTPTATASISDISPSPAKDTLIDTKEPETAASSPLEKATELGETIQPKIEKADSPQPSAAPSKVQNTQTGTIPELTLETVPPPPVNPEKQGTLNDQDAARASWYQSMISNVSPVQFNVFFNALRPYGHWFKHSDHGACWIPQVSQHNTQWRPYLSDGKWTYNDGGWLWVSNYRWGGYPFHYGRWFHTSKGWAWKPEGQWSNAWVSWRNGAEHCGWAPLPPNKDHSTSVAATLRHRVSTDDLTSDHYVFVPKEHLLDPQPITEVLNPKDAKEVFEDSSRSDHFFVGKGRRWINRGVPIQDVSSRMKLTDTSTPTNAAHPPTTRQSQALRTQQYVPFPGNQYQQTLAGATRPGNQQNTANGRTSVSPSSRPNTTPTRSSHNLTVRNTPTTTSNARINTLLKAQQTPNVANYNKVNPPSTRSNNARQR